MADAPALTAESVRKILHYEESTGVFTWRTTSGPRKAGTVAGGAALGYWAIGVGRRRYQAHRLAWLYVYGVWPQVEVDHINRDRFDNRIENLRLASRRQNGANLSLSCRNTSGVKGVTWDKRSRKWLASIMVDRKRKHVGYFNDIGLAAAAYDRAAEKAFGRFAATNGSAKHGR